MTKMTNAAPTTLMHRARCVTPPSSSPASVSVASGGLRRDPRRAGTKPPGPGARPSYIRYAWRQPLVRPSSEYPTRASVVRNRNVGYMPFRHENVPIGMTQMPRIRMPLITSHLPRFVGGNEPSGRTAQTEASSSRVMRKRAKIASPATVSGPRHTGGSSLRHPSKRRYIPNDYSVSS